MIKTTTKRLKEYPIKCFKYTNSMNDKIEIRNSYTQTIRISEDGKRLIIMNKQFTLDALYRFETVKSSNWHKEEESSDYIKKITKLNVYDHALS